MVLSGDAEFRHILYRREGGVGHLILNRPDKLNALGFGPGSNREEVVAALRLADGDAKVGCILISAAGDAFCAGGRSSSTPQRV
jgi:enoyl-CoA hydratase/carnithine racemase